MRKTAIIKACEECQVSFETTDTRKRFCKRSCSASHNNRTRGGLPLKDCIGVCGNKIQAREGQEYCSANCRQTTLYINWAEQKWTPTTQEFPVWLRKFLIVRGCSRCEWNEFNIMTGLSPLQIDHKNGDSSDHSFSNIQVLCPNCHSLTMNYGALNKGNGRKHRYAQVKKVQSP